MRRLLIGTIAAVTGSVMTGASASAATPDLPPWAAEVAHQAITDPAALVAQIVDGRPLDVVVTRIVDGAPVFEKHAAADEDDVRRIAEKAQADPTTLGLELDQVYRPTLNDPGASQQWALGALGATSSWAISRGTGVRVAVIDTGVDVSHPDLKGNILAAWSTVGGYTNTSGSTNVTPCDEHGTHVAGIIAAKTNNSVGVAGLAFGAKILAVKVFNRTSTGCLADTVDLAEGIRWAADHGAQVINMSLESGSASTAVTQAVAYARSKRAVVIAAAGNKSCSFGSNSVSYPAGNYGVIGVGSTDSNGSVSCFSKQNASVDLVAPGGNILSTVPSGYASFSGTSMAAPYVAASAALTISALGSVGWTPDSVESWLRALAQDRGAFGRDNAYGNGFVQPVRTLRRVKSTVSIGVSPTKVAKGGSVAITGVAKALDGTPRPQGHVVRIQTTLSGVKRAWNVSIGSGGAYRLVIRIPHDAKFTATYLGGSAASKATRSVTYTGVY